MYKNINNIIMGKHAVTAALNSDKTINRLFIQANSNSKTLNSIINIAKEKKIIISRVPKIYLDKLSHNQNHQGVILSISSFKYYTIDDLFRMTIKRQEDPFFLILDRIEDPHNLGSILRTADAFGINGIIIPKRRSAQLTDVVSKISTGAIEYVPVVRVTNLVNTVRKLKEKGLWIFGTDMDGKNINEWNARGSIAIIIGNEGRGISRILKMECDEIISIPMIGNVQSLNVSVAASLFMYKAFISRNF